MHKPYWFPKYAYFHSLAQDIMGWQAISGLVLASHETLQSVKQEVMLLSFYATPGEFEG